MFSVDPEFRSAKFAKKFALNKDQIDTFKDSTLPRYAVLDASGKVLGTTDYTTAKDVTAFGKWLTGITK